MLATPPPVVAAVLFAPFFLFDLIFSVAESSSLKGRDIPRALALFRRILDIAILRSILILALLITIVLALTLILPIAMAVTHSRTLGIPD